MDAARADLERRIATLHWPAIKSAVLELADSRPTPVPLSDIEAFEQECGVSLPDEYREFLLMIGVPAPGPRDGLVPFGCGFPHDGDLPPELWEFPVLSEEERGSLRLPFPGRHTGDENADDDRDDDAMENWHAEGVLPLATDLSNYWAFLVVTGDERGRVWESEDGTHPALTPLCRPVSFREWYAVWLVREIDEELPRIRENRKIAADRFATDAELAALRDSSRR
jgi:hypothetical protein